MSHTLHPNQSIHTCNNITSSGSSATGNNNIDHTHNIHSSTNHSTMNTNHSDKNDKYENEIRLLPSATREPLQSLSTLRNKSLLDHTLLSGKLPPSQRDTKSSRKVTVQQVVHHDDVGTTTDAFECFKEDSSFDHSSSEEEEEKEIVESDIFDNIDSSFDSSSRFDSFHNKEQNDGNVDNDECHSSDAEDSMSSIKVSLHVDTNGSISRQRRIIHAATREKMLSMGRSFSKDDEEQEEEEVDTSRNTNINDEEQSRNTTTTRERKDKRLRDDFVKAGTHFRSLLQGAIDKVAVASASQITDSAKKRRLMNDSILVMDENSYQPEQEDSNHSHKLTLTHASSHEDGNETTKISSLHALTALAQEQQIEILQLRQQLSMCESKANALVHANDTLRLSSNQQQGNIQMLQSALKIAGQKATNAQADAEAAKVKADGLEMEIKGLEEKVNEFSSVCANVKMEHEDMENAVKEMESKVWFMEKELGRAVAEKEEVENEQRKLNGKVEGMRGKIRSLEEELQYKEKELEVVHITLVEKEDLQRARENRARSLEREVRDARSTLVELTSAAADAQSVVTQLQDTIYNLQQENERLHSVIQDSSEAAAKERAKLQEALSVGEMEKQKLHLDIANHEEALEQVKLDKSSLEQEVEQLKSRIFGLERSLTNAGSKAFTIQAVDENWSATDNNGSVGVVERSHTSVTETLSPETVYSDLTSSNTPGESFSNHNSQKTSSSNSSELAMASSVASEFSYKTPKKFSIPSLKSSQSKLGENSEKIGYMPTGLTDPFNRILPKPGSTCVDRSNAKICAICSKNAYGVMKACQCGDPACDKRAHANCLPKCTPISSVSHPGSTIPLPPTLLCQKSHH